MEERGGKRTKKEKEREKERERERDLVKARSGQVLKEEGLDQPPDSRCVMIMTLAGKNGKKKFLTLSIPNELILMTGR